MCITEEVFVKGIRAEAREETIFELVQEGCLTIRFAAEKLQMSEEELKKQMEAAGYKIPELV